MRSAPSGPGSDSSRVSALFASTLQRGDHPAPAQVRQAVAAAIRALGGPGCVAAVAQEFGEHPETAVARMRWARAAVAVAYGDAPDLAEPSPGCPAPLVPAPRVPAPRAPAAALAR